MLLSALCAVALSVAAASPAPVPAALELHRFTLENGLTVVLQPDDKTPLVAMDLRVDVGAADEPRNMSGVAHLLEHLRFEASELAPDGAYDRWLGDVGGDSNAWTGLDATAFQAVVPREALDLLLYLEADRMRGLAPAVTEEHLDNQRAVVQGEGAVAADEPHGLDHAAISAALFPPGHPYFRTVLGDAAALGALDIGAVDAFHARHYVPANSTLVLVGDLNPVSAEASVRRFFADLPEAPAPDRTRAASLPPTPTQGVAQRWVYTGLVDDPTLYMMWPTVPSGHADEAALDVLVEILSSGRGSRLDDALHFGGPRLDLVQAWTRNQRLAGRVIIRVSDSGRSLRSFQRGVRRQVRKIQREAPSPDELERAQRRLSAWAIRAGEGIEARAGLINDCLARRGAPDCVPAELAARGAVTPADVQRVANTWLRDDTLILLSVVDEQRRRKALSGAEQVVLP